jgi:hypothetical protein
LVSIFILLWLTHICVVVVPFAAGAVVVAAIVCTRSHCQYDIEAALPSISAKAPPDLPDVVVAVVFVSVVLAVAVDWVVVVPAVEPEEHPTIDSITPINTVIIAIVPMFLFISNSLPPFDLNHSYQVY